MRVYLYYLAGFLNMPSAQVPVFCFYPLRFFSLLLLLVLCLFLYFRVCLMWAEGAQLLAEEKKKAEREREKGH